MRYKPLCRQCREAEEREPQRVSNSRRAESHRYQQCVGMVQAAVGHKSTEVCQQVVRAMRALDEQRKKERQRNAARISAQKASGSHRTKRGEKVEACMQHVGALRADFDAEIDSAHIDQHGTPTEKFWAAPEASPENMLKANQVLGRVFHRKLQPLCSRLDNLQLRVRCAAASSACVLHAVHACQQRGSLGLCFNSCAQCRSSSGQRRQCTWRNGRSCCGRIARSLSASCGCCSGR
jgi:hypothetical protein